MGKDAMPSMRSADSNMSPMLPTKSHGFTLVEVLVALLIVALVLGAGLRAAGALTVAQQRLTQDLRRMERR